MLILGCLEVHLPALCLLSVCLMSALCLCYVYKGKFRTLILHFNECILDTSRYIDFIKRLLTQKERAWIYDNQWPSPLFKKLYTFVGGNCFITFFHSKFIAAIPNRPTSDVKNAVALNRNQLYKCPGKKPITITSSTWKTHHLSVSAQEFFAVTADDPSYSGNTVTLWEFGAWPGYITIYVHPIWARNGGGSEIWLFWSNNGPVNCSALIDWDDWVFEIEISCWRFDWWNRI